MKRDALVEYLDSLLQAAKFKDYCPNGLQVEGRGEVLRLVAGVTASQALIDEAVRLKADAVLVHHGYFWKGEPGVVTGIRRHRLKALLENDINLIAYHLPLDAHPDLGNNAQLAQIMGWQPEGRFGDQDIGWFGSPDDDVCVEDLVAQLGQALGRAPLTIGDLGRRVRRIAWCSGGAQSWFEAALAVGADVYLSGEISEPTVHLARESGVPYLACGHHATERFGVRAVAAHLAAQFGLDCRFVDIDNPV